jgi:SAM-dependent methyltransferase
MTSAEDQPENPEKDALAYLSVDRFMTTMIQGEALAAAFKTGLIDCLISRGPAPADVLAERLGTTPRGMVFLIEMLAESGVAELRDGICSLTASFLKAMEFRELMELKLALANMAARDLLGGFTDLIRDPELFMRNAGFHRLFAYERGSGQGEEDRRVTAQWMRVTTLLTRYEAAVCMRHYDFSDRRLLLDVGGNSGEFALRLCRRYPSLRTTVFDLPLVCEEGRRHVGGEPEADRITFVPGSALTDDFPAGHDQVVFKSMLHDWPEEAARHFMAKATRALEPGGRMLIFERVPVSPKNQNITYSHLPFLIFFNSYRDPQRYAGLMADAGLSDVQIRLIGLEMPFMLVTGRKK